MSQILHIFRKDVRQHWILILLCQLALAAYCWNEAESWGNFEAMALAGMTSLFLTLSWCLFIFRVVQSESLVGDRQFWVTRPYEWNKLLAEKILIILVFLTLPLLVAGAILLAFAGFPPAAHLFGLLWMQLLLIFGPFLMLFALASVTRNLIPAAIALLSLLLLMFVFAAFSLFVHGGGGMVGFEIPTRSFLGTTDFVGLILLVACIAAVGLQYARRKTSQSRLLLVGGVVAAVAISFATAYAGRNRVPFPLVAGHKTPFHVAPDPGRLVPAKRAVEKNEVVPIGVPVSNSGIPEGSLGWVRGARLVLEAPDGYRWDGRWPGSTALLAPGENRWRPMFQMEYEAYQRLKSAPLRARVSIYGYIFHDERFENITVTANEFAVPGVGRCRFWRRERYNLRCNSPLVRPAMVVARVDPTQSTCPVEDVPPALPPKPLEGLPYAWEHGSETTLPAGGISPVAASFFYFWEFSDRVNICPGTPVTFSFPRFVEDVRVDFEIDNLHLDDYRQADFSPSTVTGANGVRLGLPAPGH